MIIDVSEIKAGNLVPFERKPLNTLGKHKIKNRENPRSSYCRHRSTELDSEKREIVCQDCGSIVEPFDWVKATLEENARFWNERTALRKEIQKNQQQLEQLKAEESKVKARLRNARESLTKVEAQAIDRAVTAKKHIDDLNALLGS